MCTYVCMYVRTHVCMYVCTYVSLACHPQLSQIHGDYEGTLFRIIQIPKSGSEP